MERTASTVSEAINALGGTKKVAILTGRKTQAVSNWRKLKFPSNTYLALKAALEKEGYNAPASLWGMKEPAGCKTLSNEEGTA